MGSSPVPQPGTPFREVTFEGGEDVAGVLVVVVAELLLFSWHKQVSGA